MFSSCIVYSSIPGIVRSGLVNTTIVLQIMVSTPAVNVQQCVLASFLRFGIIFFTGQMVYLKKKRNVLNSSFLQDVGTSSV